MVKFCKKLKVDEFNRALIEKRSVRFKYRRWATKIKKQFIDPYPGIKFTIVPELEDNLTDKTFKILLRELKIVFRKNKKQVGFARNINGIGRYKDYPMEVHHTNKNILKIIGPGDIVSFDGSEFMFPEEGVKNNVPTFNDIKELLRKASKKRVHVYVWRYEFQGLDKNNPQPPNKRQYRFKYINRLKELMRL